jgi:hypothetical protein
VWSSGENNFLCSRAMNYVLLDGGNFLLIENYPSILLVIPLITAKAYSVEEIKVSLCHKSHFSLRLTLLAERVVWLPFYPFFDLI